MFEQDKNISSILLPFLEFFFQILITVEPSINYVKFRERSLPQRFHYPSGYLQASRNASKYCFPFTVRRFIIPLTAVLSEIFNATISPFSAVYKGAQRTPYTRWNS